MAFVPVTTRMSRDDPDGKRVRLYAGPQFVPVAGILCPIDEAVKVARDDASGAYRVTLGDDWIEFRPAVRPKDQLVRAVVGEKARRPFGDIIKASAAEPSVRYDVAFSAGVELSRNGWRFKTAGEEDVGLLLTDWRRRFGADRVRLAADYAELDLSAHLAALEAAGTKESASINLDPLVTEVSFTSVGVTQRNGWTSTRTWFENEEVNYDYLQVGYDIPEYTGPTTTMPLWRAAMRFGTWDVPARLSYLHLWVSTCDAEGIGATRTQFAAITPPLDVGSEYPRIKTYGSAHGYEHNAHRGEQPHPWFGRFDLTAEWTGAVGDFDVGLFEWDHDKEGPFPGWNTSWFAYFEYENPWLEYEAAPDIAPARTLMGAGT